MMDTIVSPEERALFTVIIIKRSIYCIYIQTLSEVLLYMRYLQHSHNGF